MAKTSILLPIAKPLRIRRAEEKEFVRKTNQELRRRKELRSRGRQMLGLYAPSESEHWSSEENQSSEEGQSSDAQSVVVVEDSDIEGDARQCIPHQAREASSTSDLKLAEWLLDAQLRTAALCGTIVEL